MFPGTAITFMSLQGSDGSNEKTHLFRKPQRITITLPYAVYQALVDWSDFEGRSLSNLAATLLEKSIANPQATIKPTSTSITGNGHLTNPLQHL